MRAGDEKEKGIFLDGRGGEHGEVHGRSVGKEMIQGPGSMIQENPCPEGKKKDAPFKDNVVPP
jgi:hypothetical protein